MTKASAALFVVLFGSGCSSAPPRERLFAADSAHGRATAAAGLAAGFASYLSDEAVYLQPDTHYIRGKDRILAYLGAQPAGTALSFRPAQAGVSADGAVGYTFGWTELSAPGAGVRYGKYIAFWRKQPDGSWKVEAWNRSGALDAPAAPPALPGEPHSGYRASRAVDAAAETRALIGVDSAFAAASVAGGAAEAFGRYAAAHGVSLGGGRDFVVGRDAIRADQAGGTPGQVLDWKPAMGGVGPLGDLGWTVGDYVFTLPGNPPRAFHGKYLTVWQRDSSGAWRFVVDGGSGNPPPAP